MVSAIYNSSRVVVLALRSLYLLFPGFSGPGPQTIKEYQPVTHSSGKKQLLPLFPSRDCKSAVSLDTITLSEPDCGFTLRWKMQSIGEL